MTGIRKSVCFCRERDGFGTGIHDESRGAFPAVQFAEHINTDGTRTLEIARYETYDHWLAPPPGTMFSHNHNRSVQRIQTTGSKFWDAQAYGQLSGTWEWTFPFSYDYLEPFLFVFEDVVLSATDLDDDRLEALVHRFQKANNMRVPSFTVKIVIDNEMIGSAYNEETVIKGCVVQSMQISKSNSTSVLNISLSGFYASEEMTYSSSTPQTVYREPDRRWMRTAEWAGLYRDVLGRARYMANVESLSIQLSNSSDRVFSVCSPFASNYYEGTTQISMTAGMWYSDPLQYRTLLMAQNGNIFAPRAKGDCIVGELDIITTTLQDLPVPGNFDDTPFSSTHKVPPKYAKTSEKFVQESALGEVSEEYLYMRMLDVALKSYVADKGEGSALKDNMSGVDCRFMTFDVPVVRKAATTYSSMEAGIRTRHWVYSPPVSNPSPGQTRNQEIRDHASGSNMNYGDWTYSASGGIRMMSCVRYIDLDHDVWFARLDPWFSHFVATADVQHVAYVQKWVVPEGATSGRWANQTPIGSPVTDEGMPGWVLNPHAMGSVPSINPLECSNYESWTLDGFFEEMESHVLEDAL